MTNQNENWEHSKILLWWFWCHWRLLLKIFVKILFNWTWNLHLFRVLNWIFLLFIEFFGHSDDPRRLQCWHSKQHETRNGMTSLRCLSKPAAKWRRKIYLITFFSAQWIPHSVKCKPSHSRIQGFLQQQRLRIKWKSRWRAANINESFPCWFFYSVRKKLAMLFNFIISQKMKSGGR